MHMDAIKPVLVRPCAETAAYGLEINPEAAIRLRADEAGRSAGAVAGGGHPVGHRLCERTVDEVDDALACRHASIDRRRVATIEDRSRLRRHLQRARQAGIGRHGRVDDRLHRVIDRGEERGVDHVQPGAQLRRTVEMEPHLLASHFDLDRELDLAVDLHIVEAVGESIDAVGNVRDAGAHPSLRIVLQRLAGSEHRRNPVFRAQLLHAPDTQAIGGHLRSQIGKPLTRNLAIEQDQLLHLGLQLATAVQANRRDAEPLLVDMRMAAVGEVRMVRGVDRPGDDVPGDEDRLGQHDVGQMRGAALIGIVADEDVAGAYAADGMSLHYVRQEFEETTEVHRDVLGLAERLAMHVEERRRAIATFLDVGRIAGAHQCFAHLLGDRGESAADDFDGDRIDRCPVRGSDERVSHAASSTRLR